MSRKIVSIIAAAMVMLSAATLGQVFHILPSSAAAACNEYWTGATSGAWETAGNWASSAGGAAPHAIPSGTSELCQASTITNDPTLNSTVSVYSIYFPTIPLVIASDGLTLTREEGNPTAVANEIDGLTVDSGASLTVNASNFHSDELDLVGASSNAGTVTVEGYSTTYTGEIESASEFTSSGTTDVDTYGTLDDTDATAPGIDVTGGTVTVAGSNAADEATLDTVSYTQTTGATTDLNAYGVFDASGAVSNAGTVTVTGVAATKSTFTAKTYTQSAGTTDLTQYGVLDATGGGATAVDITGGTLEGNGAVTGSVTNAGGTVNPSNAAATALAITGAYAQTSGTLQINIASATASEGTGNSELTSSSTAALTSAALDVVTNGGVTPTAGTVYTIATYSAATGCFASAFTGQVDQSAGVYYSVACGTTAATLTVKALPTVSIGAGSSTAPTSGTGTMNFTVTQSAAVPFATTVSYATSNGTATAGTQYTAASGTATIAANATTTTIPVTILAQPLFGPTTTFTMTLSSPAGSTLGSPSSNTGTIMNGVGEPTLSIGNAAITAPTSGTSTLNFTITQSATSSLATTVNYATSNGTATAGDQYNSASGTATISAGSTSTTVSVTINAQSEYGPTTNFTVLLSDASNAGISSGMATGTINNGVSEPTVSIANNATTAPTSGTTTLNFTITQSAASLETTTVNYATSDGTATAGDQYVAASGMATIASGSTSTTFSVTINAQSEYGPTTSFTSTLSSPVNATLGSPSTATGTIDNGVSEPVVTVANSSANAPTSGTTTLTFTISQTTTSSYATTVGYSFTDGSATNGNQYTATGGTATIPSGSTSTTVSATVNAQSEYGPTTSFTVTLSSPTNSTLGTPSSATGTIYNTVAEPSLSVTGGSVAAPASGTATIDFTITQSAPSQVITTIDYATSDGTATSPADYTAASGSTMIGVGATSVIVPVTVVEVAGQAPTGSFTLTLSSPENATISSGTATGTIDNPVETVSSVKWSSADPNPRVDSNGVPAGWATGGNVLVVTGTNFSALSEVNFVNQTTEDSVPATAVTYESPTELLVTAPADSYGVVDIEVTDGAGTSATNPNDEFSYLPIADSATDSSDSTTPPAGSVSGGDYVTVTGAGFYEAGSATPSVTSATFTCGVTTFPLTVSVSSDTELTLGPLPASNDTQLCHFKLESADGAAFSLANATSFLYLTPLHVTKVIPAAGPLDTTIAMRVKGTGFFAGKVSVTWDGSPIASVTCTTGSCTFDAPAASSNETVSFTVTNVLGASATESFSYYGVPTVSTVSPDVIPYTGHTKVTLTGENFVAGQTKVSIGAKRYATTVTDGGTVLEFTPPAGTPYGSISCTVVAPGGTSAPFQIDYAQ